MAAVDLWQELYHIPMLSFFDKSTLVAYAFIVIVYFTDIIVLNNKDH